MLDKTTPKELNRQIGYLQYLCNKYGDFKVAKAWKDINDNVHWTKHRSVLECQYSNEGIGFLGTVNNRTILSPEIVLDIDKDPEKNLPKILKGLDELNYHYQVFFSGSRGYHIHLFFYDLPNYTKYRRGDLRLFFINKFKCDAMKKSEGSMIALEYAPHWKTGQIKTLIKSNFCGGVEQ